MKILNILWFYSRLCIVNLSFIFWYVFHLYFSTRIFLISLCAVSFTVLLVIFQIFTWKTPFFTVVETDQKKNILLKNTPEEFTEKIYTANQINEREKHLYANLAKQPNHRDILINLTLLHSMDDSSAELTNIKNRLLIVDPNHFIVRQIVR